MSNNAPSRAGEGVFLSLSPGFEQVVQSHLQALLAVSSLLPDSPDQTDPCKDGRGESREEQWCLAAPSFLHLFLLLPASVLLKLQLAWTNPEQPSQKYVTAGLRVTAKNWDFNALQTALISLWSECDSAVGKVQPLPEEQRWIEKGESKNKKCHFCLEQAKKGKSKLAFLLNCESQWSQRDLLAESKLELLNTILYPWAVLKSSLRAGVFLSSSSLQQLFFLLFCFEEFEYKT